MLAHHCRIGLKAAGCEHHRIGINDRGSAAA
jgi:hypothetical protein